MNKKIYKNYRSKVSSPLIRELEKYEVFRRNPRLIGRVIKFMGYIAYLQFQSEIKIEMGNPAKNLKNSLEVPTTINLKQLIFQYILTNHYKPINIFQHYHSNYNFQVVSPNYSTQKASFLPIFDDYFLKVATIHWSKRAEILGDNYYAEVTKILEELSIIYCDHKKWPGERCYGYALTDRGYQLLTASQKEYFYQKIYDPKEQRNRRDRIRNSGYKNKVYASPLLQRIKSNIDGLDNIEELHEISRTLEEKAEVVAHYLLDSLLEKDFPDLEIHPLTGRVYSHIHMLPKPIKRAAIINGKTLAACIDVRSCHPTYLGLYIGVLASERYGEIDDSLRREIDAYTTLFCDPVNHPRQVIKDQIERDYGNQLEDIQAVKDGLNHFINGSKKPIPRLFRRWLEDNYPTIFAIWDSTNTKQTGNNIAAMFEFPIFRDDEVIAKGEELGLILVDNHDELMIFGSRSKTEKFLDWFEARAVKVSGINVHLVRDWTDREEKAA